MEEKQQSQIIALFLLKSEYSSCTKELSLGDLKILLNIMKSEWINMYIQVQVMFHVYITCGC